MPTHLFMHMQMHIDRYVQYIHRYMAICAGNYTHITPPCCHEKFVGLKNSLVLPMGKKTQIGKKYQLLPNHAFLTYTIIPIHSIFHARSNGIFTFHFHSPSSNKFFNQQIFHVILKFSSHLNSNLNIRLLLSFSLIHTHTKNNHHLFLFKITPHSISYLSK